MFQVLCTAGPEGGPTLWSKEESTELHEKVGHEYFVHLIVDNLPCATQFTMPSG